MAFAKASTAKSAWKSKQKNLSTPEKSAKEHRQMLSQITKEQKKFNGVNSEEEWKQAVETVNSLINVMKNLFLKMFQKKTKALYAFNMYNDYTEGWK